MSSPSKLFKAVVTFYSTAALYSYVIRPGPNGNPSKFLPTLILVLYIILASSGGKSGALRVTFGDSAWCTSFFLWLWYYSIIWSIKGAKAL